MGRFSRHRSSSNAGIAGPSDTRSSASYVSTDIGSHAPPLSASIVNEVPSGDVAVAVITSGNGSNKTVISSYVTQPPKPAKGLTGKISTLFRRESSKERNDEKIDEFNRLSAETSRSASTQPSIVVTHPANIVASQNQNTSEHDGDNLDIYAHQKQKQRNDLKNDVSAAANIPQICVRTGAHEEEDDDEQSVGAVSFHSAAGSTSKRIFYSSNQDDDSDDSYESRVSRVSKGSRSSRDAVRDASGSRSRGSSRRQSRSISIDSAARTTFTTDGDDEDESDIYSRGLSEVQSSFNQTGGIRRYKGFSTSIRSLFLDEPLVCAAMGCFGLVLSNRTEYLLQLRNERRGVLDPRRDKKTQMDARKKSPSRIVGFGLVITLVLMFTTFIIWGFGSGVNNKDAYLNEYMNGYDNAEEGNIQYWDDYLSKDDDRFGSRNYKRYKNKDDQNSENGYYSTNDDNSNQNEDDNNNETQYTRG